MSIPNREKHQNNSRTTLAEDLDNSETTITVTDGSVFPSAGIFRLICESEIMICTARSTNDLTVVRGAEGSAAAVHDNGDDIQLIYTAASLDEIVKNTNGLWGYASNLPRGVFNDAGTGRLVASDFTWVNQGGASVSDGTCNNIYLRTPTDAAATNLRMLARTPGVATFAYVAGIRAFGYGDTSFHCVSGLGLRENATGKVMTIGLAASNNAYNYAYLLGKWSASATLVGGSYTRSGPMMIAGDELFLRVELDASNVKFAYSLDGFEWIEIFSEAKATHFTTAPDEVVFYGLNYTNSSAELIASLDHWHKE